MFVLNIWVCVSTALLDHFISELSLIENWWSTSQHCTVNQLYLLLSVIFQSVILSFFPYFSLRGILFRGGSATTKRFWGAIINYTKKSVWILQNMRLNNVLQLKRHCLKCTVPDFLRWQNSEILTGIPTQIFNQIQVGHCWQCTNLVVKFQQCFATRRSVNTVS